MAIFGKHKIDHGFLKSNSAWVLLTEIAAIVVLVILFVHVMRLNPRKPTTSSRIVAEGELNAEAQIEQQPAELRGVVARQVIQGRNLNQSLQDIVAQVRPTVIKIVVPPGTSKVTSAAANETGIKFGDPYMVSQDKAVGAGVLVDSKGHFLTTRHVVGDAKDLQVILYRAGQKNYSARVLSYDPNSILVMGKIRSNDKFPSAKLGDSDRLRTGDIVLAVGSPFSLSGTVTSGIVSGKKDLVVDGQTFNGVIQTDAAINEGNAGGPIVNSDGEVVGITFASYVDKGAFTGIGFALPINQAKEIWGTK